MNTNVVQIKQLSAELGVAFGTSGVRGLVKDLTPMLCFAFVRSFLQTVCPSTSKLVIGMDLRPSSPGIAKACLLAAESFGAKVVFCGALPTPALAFYAMQNNIPAVMITGSHIPFDRNGIKFYRPDGEISKADETSIMDGLVEVPEFVSAQAAQLVLPVIDYSAIELFKQRYTSLFSSTMLQGKRIGVYEHSSVARDVIKELLVHFGAEVISLERTETFVPIDTEAVSDEDVQKGLNWSKQYKLDAIISTDGDGDRPLIANEKGEWLRGDILGVLCSNYLKATHVVAPVNVNTVLELEGEKLTPKRTSERTCIGSPYVIEAMEVLLTQAPSARVVGYEANGGFLVGSGIYINGQMLNSLPTRDSVLPVLVILAMSFEQKRPLSELSFEFASRFTSSGRIKDISKSMSYQLIEDIKLSKTKQERLLSHVFSEKKQRDEELKVMSIDETDGLRVTLNNGDIIHLRASGNAPELRCYIETNINIKSVNLCKSVLQYISAMVHK